MIDDSLACEIWIAVVLFARSLLSGFVHSPLSSFPATSTATWRWYDFVCTSVRSGAVVWSRKGDACILALTVSGLSIKLFAHRMLGFFPTPVSALLCARFLSISTKPYVTRGEWCVCKPHTQTTKPRNASSTQARISRVLCKWWSKILLCYFTILSGFWPQRCSAATAKTTTTTTHAAHRGRYKLVSLCEVIRITEATKLAECARHTFIHISLCQHTRAKS